MNKKYSTIIVNIALIIFIAFVGLFSVKNLGVKDGGMITLSAILVIFIFMLAAKNLKLSICLFIISMPILVTARKIFYFDFLIFKINLESILILFFVIKAWKDIKSFLINELDKGRTVKIFAYSLIALVVSSYISVIYSTNIMESLRLTNVSILVPILLLIVIISVFKKADVKYLVYSLIISINLSCLYGLIQAAGLGLSLSAIKNGREYLTFGYHNSNIFVGLSMMIFPITINELLYEKNSLLGKIFLILSVSLQSIAIFITFSRGAWLTLAMVVVAILFSKKYKYIFAAIFIIGLISSPIILPKILSRGSSEVHFLQNTSNTARIQSIVTSIEIMKQKPFGTGFGEFNTNFREHIVDGYLSIDEHLRDKMEAPLYSLESAHNYFLNTGVELGILALIAMLVIIAIGVKSSISNYKDNRPYFIALGMFVFLGLTTGAEINHKGVLTNTYVFWLLFALIYLNNYKKNVEV